MKTDSPCNKISASLAALGLALFGIIPAWSQVAVYAAPVTSTNTEAWDSPFYWVANGGTAYDLSTGKSVAPGTPSRVGSYYHTGSTTTVGEG
jgi:hypothetical protein